MRRTAWIVIGLAALLALLGDNDKPGTASGNSAGGGSGSADPARALSPRAPGTRSEDANSSPMPVYCDGRLLSIDIPGRPGAGSRDPQTRAAGGDVVYRSDARLPDGKPFISVLGSLQGEPFHPLWLVRGVAFTAGHSARQLHSTHEVLVAAASREISLGTPTLMDAAHVFLRESMELSR
jgi:hypothetical protein